MTSDTFALPVTIVSTDRSLLRELSWTLAQFGYQVTASCDYSDESPWRRSATPQLLLLDARSSDEVREVLAAPRLAAFTYRIAIQESDSEVNAERLLSMGADDVIRYPVNTGELLTRLRVGVRRLEFERRLATRQHCDALTGVSSRRALGHALERQRGLDGSVPLSQVICGIDFLGLIREQYGGRAIQHLKLTLSRCLLQHLEEKEHCGVLNEGLFVVLLNRPLDQATQFAESLASEFSTCDTLVRELRCLPTLSAAVAPWSKDTPTAQQLDSSEAIFEQVRSYGGNCVVQATTVQQEISKWRAHLDGGVPFEQVVAQDMMEMFPLLFTQQQLEAGFASSLISPETLQVPCIPVVDDAGKLVGAFSAGQLENLDSAETSVPKTVSHVQPLNELFETFATVEDEPLVVVDDENHPLGYLTGKGLTSLVHDRMDSTKYRAWANGGRTLTSLIVPVEPPQTRVEMPSVAP